MTAVPLDFRNQGITTSLSMLQFLNFEPQRLARNIINSHRSRDGPLPKHSGIPRHKLVQTQGDCNNGL